jgi:radical SAM superfamily enzyme YgiQ (UPF0313 family)
MLTLINSNRMTPPIAPVGLDYVAGAARDAGIRVEVLDLCLAEDPKAATDAYFTRRQPDLVGISFRNVDDCFWPGRSWFVPQVDEIVRAVRKQSDAPVVLGGIGYSIFPEELVRRTGVDFGVRGDGERSIVQLVEQLRGPKRFQRVEGLVWRQNGRLRANPPAWPDELSVPTRRDVIDNRAYFQRGGQLGIETKRGCNRNCLYCVEPLAKGTAARLRFPSEVADEIEALLAQDIDVLHLCDSEFNVPVSHARAVCDEIIRRGLGERVRWYTYMAVTPFDSKLAGKMRRAGCVGINFASDAANPEMLATYRHRHRKEHLGEAVRLCRRHGISVMLDLLLGGPGETLETVAESIRFFQKIEPDCVGAALGVRLYSGTGALSVIADESPLERHPGIHRRYEGPIDLLRPTFYVSPALGEKPAELIRDLIGGDPRFFEPVDEDPVGSTKSGPYTDYNYSENRPVVEAIQAGQRGAYWDILRRLRSSSR